MNLTVIIKGIEYGVTFSEDFSNKLQELNSNYNHVLKELQQAESELGNLKVGEEFFVVGNQFGYSGVFQAGNIDLVKLITTIL